MQLTNYAASWEDEPRKEDRSRQREKQLRIDQPIVMYYTQNYTIYNDTTEVKNSSLSYVNVSMDLNEIQAIQSRVAIAS